MFLSACAGSERHERSLWYVATTGSDSNPCTVDLPCRTVVEAFGRADADDEIIIAAGTYNEVDPSARADYYLFNVRVDLLVRGAGADTTIIDLGNLYAGFYTSVDARLRLEGITIQNARGNSPGGCLYAIQTSTASLEDVTLRHCLYMGIGTNRDTHVDLTNVVITDSIIREPYGAGVGVFNSGTMTIQGGEIFGNETIGVVSNGALEINGTNIHNNRRSGLSLYGGSTTLADVQINNNVLDVVFLAGFEIYNGASASGSHVTLDNNHVGVRARDAGTTLLLQDSSISNSARMGVDIQAGAMVTLDTTSIDHNGAANVGTGIIGGIDNRGGLVLRSSQVTANYNGGITNEGEGDVQILESSITENAGRLAAIDNANRMNIQNSLIANNVANNGGAEVAIGNIGDLIMINSTVSRNQGIGINPIEGSLILSYVTIAENTNTGLNIYRGGSAISQLDNVIIANNLGRGNCGVVGFGFPAIPMSGANIETEPLFPLDGCGFSLIYTTAELMLGPLADNGGPTLTHELLPGSPARDAATGACPAADQRIAPRPVGPRCDVGAYEAGAVATSLDFPTPTPELPMLTLVQDYPCYTGPGPAYNTLTTLKAGTQLQIVGYGFNGGWLVAFHPTLPEKHCWIDEEFVSFITPVDQLRLIAVPPKPTPTPSPTAEPRKPTACPTNPQIMGVCQ